ncbi:hypothetical protein I6L51_00105 [Citrobacter braakii]|nr:hypothetical protein I6L51_00105 [Citrobacter braakii]
MFRIKALLDCHLSLRGYEAQAGETVKLLKALNGKVLLGMQHLNRTTGNPA